jgi:hypothetical protein
MVVVYSVMSYTSPCTGKNSIADNINTIQIGDFDKLPGGEAGIQMLINLMMYLDSRSVIYFLKTSIFKNINNDKINAFIIRIRYNLLIKNYKDKFPHDSPFISACRIGLLENVKLLVNNHPSRKYFINRDVNNNDNNNMTLKEYVNQVHRINEGINKGHEFTPLMIAVKYQHFHVVQYLINQCEVDTNIIDDIGCNVLHWAVNSLYPNTMNVYIMNVDLIQYLLKHMSIDSINRKSQRGKTPLDSAYLQGFIDSQNRLDVIKLIHSEGGKLNYRENGRLLDDDLNKDIRHL